MLRRRLCSYTVFFISGISAGFFMLERSRFISAAAFTAAMLTAALSVEPYDKTVPGKSGRVIRFRQMLVIMLLSGLVIFSINYIGFRYAERYVTGSTRVMGTVINCVPSGEKIRLTLRSRDLWHPKVLVTLKSYDEETGPAGLYGAEIEAYGQYRDIEPASDPGCFDYGIYLRGRGTGLLFGAEGIRIAGKSESILILCRKYLYGMREDFISLFDDDTSGFIRGVIFGDKRDIDEELINEFNQNSTGHILAVSGLHMGFLFGLLKVLTGRRRTPALSFIVIAVLVIYGEMTMWSSATVRACLVTAASIISIHVRRRFDLLTSVCSAAFCILAAEPYQLFDAGFQLSFLAMTGISIVTRPIASVTGDAIAAALAVQLSTVPAAAYIFNCFEPFALFINIPVILLASVLVPLCIIMLMIQIIIGAVPGCCISLAEIISCAVIQTNHLLGVGTGPAIKTAGFGAVLTVLYYLALFGASSEWIRVLVLRNKKRKILKLAALVMLPLIALSSCLYNSLADDEVVFVSVGQGDCTHIRAAGRNVLIDGGGDPGYGSEESGSGTGGYNVGEKVLMPYLLHSGAGSVDAALVTHLHADHYKGITELAEVLPVGMIGIPIDYRADSEEIAGTYDAERIIYIGPDTKLEITDDVYIDVLWPLTVSDKPLAADDPNEHNTVYMIHYGSIKIMVTGDLLEEDELKMVKHYEGTDRLRCDVLKVAHHGSKSSSSEAFLDAASPSAAVIQVGPHNFYGHPHQQTLDRLEARGIRVFRTDLNGAVGIDIRGKKICIDLYRK